jgi:hypothetical protein
LAEAIANAELIWDDKKRCMNSGVVAQMLVPISMAYSYL